MGIVTSDDARARSPDDGVETALADTILPASA